jgi:hypothetical protein
MALDDLVNKAFTPKTTQILRHKDTRRYLIADAIAFCAGMGAAEAVTIWCHAHEFSDLANVTVTLAARSICFYAANITAYTLLHRDSHKAGNRSARIDARKLSRANIYGAVVSDSLKFVGHLAALQCQWFAYWAAPLVVYPIAGIAGSGLRHYLNYKGGIIVPKDISK